MSRPKFRVALLLLLIVLVFSGLALLYWDFIRETVVVPIYYLLWVSGLMLRSIPQGVYLAGLLLAGVLLGLNTLDRVRGRQASAVLAPPPAQTHSRYLHWRTLGAGLATSPFARSAFASDARQLIMDILAYEHGVERGAVETLVKQNVLVVPETIRFLIIHRELDYSSPSPRGLRDRLRQRLPLLQPASADARPDRQMAEIITFIEQHVEKTNVGE